MQAAYQVELRAAATAQIDGGAAWDGGRVASPKSVAVPYAGPPLTPGDEYELRVRTYDRLGRRSPWSVAQAVRVEPVEGRPLPPRRPIGRRDVRPLRAAEVSPGHYFVEFARAAFGTLRGASTAASRRGRTRSAARTSSPSRRRWWPTATAAPWPKSRRGSLPARRRCRRA